MDLLNCPVKATVDVLGGKWKPLILYHLKLGPQRFNELRRRIPGATQKMLTQQLREMERDAIIHREVHAQVPPKVEYSLSEYGKTLRPLLELMCSWGLKHQSRQKRMGSKRPR
ncbi:MAG: transcriptional regulator, HxlR family [Pedosphaera sp.]|nr:transcriptional regulator, HxlR family [Pedosphaera sp.]